MIHIYKQGTNGRTLLLLHGTGGDEYDLLPLAQMIDSNANVLSIRGNVLENGMSRYFRRINEGVFDEEDLLARTHELYNFIVRMSKEYNFDLAKLVGFGYSNGANILGSILFNIPNPISYVILSHPMVPIRNVVLPDLSNVEVFIGAGLNDPIVPILEAEELGELLTNANANVEYFWSTEGHRLSQKEIFLISKWYEKRNI